MTDAQDRTFKPTIRQGRILAGGVRLAELRDGHLVFDDSDRWRCRTRGTPDVPVDLMELLEALLLYYQSQQ